MTHSPDTINALLRPLEMRINERIARSATARNICKELQRKVLLVRVEGLEIDVSAEVLNGILELGVAEQDCEAAATLSGGPFSLLRLLGDSPEDAIRNGHVELTGDGDVLEAYQALFKLTRPELEEDIAAFVGDSAARQITLIGKELKGWFQGARKGLGRSTAEYLKEESRDLPAKAEVEAFYDDVDALAQAVDRAGARLNQLRNSAGDEHAS